MKKNNILLLLLLFFSQFIFSQKIPREILNGQIISDSIGVENVNIQNLNTKKFAISDKFGFFALYAQEHDTLVFSSLNLYTKKLVLTKTDLNWKLLKINIENFVNTLDEVIINPNALTGNLKTDSDNIKVTIIKPIDSQLALKSNYEKDKYSTLENKLMPGYLDTTYMMNFIGIASKIANLISPRKEKKKKTIAPEITFHTYVKEQFSETFFKETLKLKTDQIGLFLAFCENDLTAKKFLDINKRFELIEFLIAKQKEFVIINKE